MRISIVILIVILAASIASAQHLGNSPPVKLDSHVMNDPNAIDGREGGETIEDAFPIDSLPFNDTGATCDNLDDYDETCPMGAVAPDVVYSFASTISGAMSVDLWGSDYDTKVYVYDSNMNVVGCNDDYYPGYVSFIQEVIITAGETYYIVVDGYYGCCGNYVLTVIEVVILPPMECPPGAQLEGEPPLSYNYVDNWNGGCNSTPPVFGYIDCQDFCGVGGWYIFQGTNYRDTDWYECTAAGSTITWTVDAESEVDLYQLGVADCNNIELLYWGWAGPDWPTVNTLNTTPGEVVCLFTASSVFSNPGGFPNGMFNYVYLLEGIVGTSATENQTWSGVKSLYR